MEQTQYNPTEECNSFKRRDKETREQILDGGREGKIKKNGDKVIRPANEWSADVHKFLTYLISESFSSVPEPYGFTEKNEEILSYVPGTAYNYPLPEIFLDDEMIILSAKLLKKYHETGRKYVEKLGGNEKWMLPKVEPIEVMRYGILHMQYIVGCRLQARKILITTTI